MKRFFFCLFIMLFVSYIGFSETNNGILILNDGREYRGKLVSINETTIVFEIKGINTSFERTLVNKINFERIRDYDNAKNINDIKDSEIQTAFADSKKWKIEPDKKAVILLDKISYSFEKNLSVKINIKKAIKILNDDGKELSTQYFYYLRNYYHAKLLYAITILPDGSVFSIDEQALNDEPVNNFNTNYDKLNRVKFGLKNIDVESMFVWEAEIVGEINDLDNQFFVERNLISENPVSKRIVEISVPDELNLKTYISKGMIDYKIPEIKKTKSGNKTVYSMVESNINEYINDEDDLPDFNLIYPFLYLSFDTSWDKISGDYFDKYFSKPVSQKFQDMAKKIVRDEKDKSKIVKYLYEYINRQIDFTGLSLSGTGYVPTSEEKLADYSSMDVLDKSYLFSRLCSLYDIDVRMYFYRNNSQSELINACPSLKQFDSVICEVKIDNPEYYSFENENYKPGQRDLSSSEAYALDVTARLSKPVILKKIMLEENQIITNYSCELKNDNTLLVTRTTAITGISESVWRSLRFLSKEELDKWTKSKVSGLGDDVKIESYKFINDLNDFNKGVIFEEKLMVNNFSFSSGKNIKLFQAPDISYKAGNVSKSERIFPYNFGAASKAISSYVIKLPSGYKINRMPDPVNIGNDNFKFNFVVTAKGNVITMNIESTVNERIIPAAKYKELKDWFESRAKFALEWFIVQSAKK